MSSKAASTANGMNAPDEGGEESDVDDSTEELVPGKRSEVDEEKGELADVDDSSGEGGGANEDQVSAMVTTAAAAKQAAIRRRRGSRASRNSGSMSDSRTKSRSEDDDDDLAESTMSPRRLSDSQGDDQKSHTRRKRKRHVNNFERALRHKMAELEKALSTSLDSNAADTEEMARLATSEGGLLDDAIRRRAWPRLANVRIVSAADALLPSQAECEAHSAYTQVVLDVDRSLKRFPPGIHESERPELQDQLTRLIVRVLLTNPDLHYYQGYHDVAITFLLVVGEEMGYHIMQRLSLGHLKDFMAPTMEKTSFMLNYVYALVKRQNSELYNFMEASGVGTIFALPWMITWFGHVLPDYEDVVRLYDFFLAQPPLMPIYLAAALVLHREKEVLLCDCEMSAVHAVLSRIPSDLPIEKLIVDAQQLYEAFPPLTVEADARRRFERQKKELEAVRQGRLKKGKDDSPLYTPVVVGVLVVTAPVFVGYVAWKWFHQ